MEILRGGDVPFKRSESSAETRRYYELAQHGFRLVETQMPPGHVQNEHRHDQLLDIILVLEGVVQVTQREDGVIREDILHAGDMACFSPPFFHNIANPSEQPARTLTLKIRADSGLSPDAVAKLFQTDWIGYGDA
jgi:quercetin dioxygenase-like cupin family protein